GRRLSDVGRILILLDSANFRERRKERHLKGLQHRPVVIHKEDQRLLHGLKPVECCACAASVSELCLSTCPPRLSSAFHRLLISEPLITSLDGGSMQL